MTATMPTVRVPGGGVSLIPVSLPPVPGPFQVATEAIVFDPASPFSYSGTNGMFFVIR